MLPPCKLEELFNESDVEQKLLWQLLTNPVQEGCGYCAAEIYTKANIKTFEIEKGTAKKVYRPDYIILLAGLPVMVVEVKRPDEDLNEAIREARLYAAELNSLYPSGVNPCVRLVASNGKKLITCPADSVTIDVELDFVDLNLGSNKWHDLLALIGRHALIDFADKLRANLRPGEYRKATHRLGGKSARNDEVGYNEFGSRISIDFVHIFNPQTRQDRADVVKKAYVPSRRREHYTDEIDRVIRTALPIPAGSGKLIEDTSNPSQLLRLLGRGRDLQNRLFLLVGARGAGKSTFVDYVREVKLDQATKKATTWVSIDLNNSPTTRAMLESWVVDQIIDGLITSAPDEKLQEHEGLLKVFSVEMQALKQGPLKLLSPTSDMYKETVASELLKLTQDRVKYAISLTRTLCTERSKLFTLVLDNCDKGDLDEQLTVFQIVRWIQSWLKCLVFLPIRDVTYHAHKSRPPLDTVIKDFVFRIEAPPFGTVLRDRIQMALTQAGVIYGGDMLSYHLDNGAKVVYPPTEIGYYLACIYRSLFDHDKLLRKMLIGLAGKDMRKAMEIFLDFCKSGHIRSGELLKIRVMKGNHTLPYKVVTRVLLRLNRRFYDGSESHLKNLFQCDPTDPRPDHFVRLGILRWLESRFRLKGPTGVKAFHRVDTLLSALLPLGHNIERVRLELQYLIQGMCVLTEHQRDESLTDDDLIALSPAGFAHLDMIKNFDYLAACSEDTWLSDHELVDRIAQRIGAHGERLHYARETTRANASEFVEYLVNDARLEIVQPTACLTHIGQTTLMEMTAIQQEANRKIAADAAKYRWQDIDGRFKIGEVYEGSVAGKQQYGVFVILKNGPKGLLHFSKLGKGKTLDSYNQGDIINVKITAINREERKLALEEA
jgi:hypothetical protein